MYDRAHVSYACLRDMGQGGVEVELLLPMNHARAWCGNTRDPLNTKEMKYQQICHFCKKSNFERTKDVLCGFVSVSMREYMLERKDFCGNYRTCGERARR
jgi:hypothetical protein